MFEILSLSSLVEAYAFEKVTGGFLLKDQKLRLVVTELTETFTRVVLPERRR